MSSQAPESFDDRLASVLKMKQDADRSREIYRKAANRYAELLNDCLIVFAKEGIKGAIVTIIGEAIGKLPAAPEKDSPPKTNKEIYQALLLEANLICKEVLSWPPDHFSSITHTLARGFKLLAREQIEETQKEEVLLEALRQLTELKHIKRKIEGGSANESEINYYQKNKETCWKFAESVMRRQSI